MALKLLCTVDSLLEAELIIDYLKSYTIKAQHFDSQINTLIPAGNLLAPVRIMVDDYDLESALKHLELYKKSLAQSQS